MIRSLKIGGSSIVIVDYKCVLQLAYLIRGLVFVDHFNGFLYAVVGSRSQIFHGFGLAVRVIIGYALQIIQYPQIVTGAGIAVVCRAVQTLGNHRYIVAVDHVGCIIPI